MEPLVEKAADPSLSQAIKQRVSQDKVDTVNRVTKLYHYTKKKIKNDKEVGNIVVRCHS